MSVVLQDKIVKTKKERQCFCCLRKFPTGTSMNYWVTVHDGDFGAGYICQICCEIMNIEIEDEYPEGFVNDNLHKGETPEQYLEKIKELK